MNELRESAINIVSEGSEIRGDITFDQITRVHGVLKGEISTKDGSTLILSENSMVEGNIYADTLWVDGFVRGNITARTLVVVSCTGRVIGNIRAKNLQLEFGAYFEGRCSTEGQSPS